ncbi:MAG: hypothetical protein M3375_01150 [Actinomycetota bacterium]|nr:hypothetical protein [Actinomycetota bacterium]
MRIGGLHAGEREDTFRDLQLPVASLDGVRETDAFYYGGFRATREVRLRSGHHVTGTLNHRLLTADPEGGLAWKQLDELEPGDQVATQYGDDMWSDDPARLDDFVPGALYGCQKRVTLPRSMSEELAFFLGAYAAEGWTSRSNYTVILANADEGVIARLAEAAKSLFGIQARITRQENRCPTVQLSSKTLVEFLSHLGCGTRASDKRIPGPVLRSPKAMVLAFLEGLSLDCYLPKSLPKWAICLDSKGLLDDLQAILTNLGIVHSRVSKFNAEYDKSFDEVYAHGSHAQRLAAMLDFPEAHKAIRATELAALEVGGSWADVVPGLSGRELYACLPRGHGGRSGRGTGHSREFRHLVDPRTRQVSRSSLERVAAVAGVVELPDWTRVVLERNLHFSPVVEVADGGEQEVYDISVPETHAFVGNGIVNHNTVNLPESATVEDIEGIYLEGWKLGLKALAIYRDGSKTAQALRTDSQEEKGEPAPEPAPEPRPYRKRMPRERMSITHKFSIAGHEGYITAGMYEDGSVGEIFLTDIGKEGSTLRGMMNAFATSISLALQYGVPLETLVRKFSYMRFDPEGITGNPEVPFAKSMPDYIMRWLASRFLDADIQEELGILTPEVRTRKMQEEALMRGDTAAPAGNGGNSGGNGHSDASNGGASASVKATAAPPTEQSVKVEKTDGTAQVKPASAAFTDEPPVTPAKLQGLDLGPACGQCGGMMQRTGSCYTCSSCGNNTGCG